MRRRGSRGFVIVAVLVAGLGGIWIATSLLFVASADTRLAVVSRSAVQQRSRAVSALRFISTLLIDQRPVILAGGTPRLERQYTLWEVDDQEAVVRLLPGGPSGEILIPEAGRVDVNHATLEMLTALAGLDATVANAVVSQRDQRMSGRFFSLAELLEVDGLDPDDLFGDAVADRSMDQALGASGDVGDRIAQRLAMPRARGLVDLLTVHGFEPNLQQNGRRRINLDVPWSAELQRRVADRFDETVASVMAGLFEATSFSEEGDVVRTLRELDVPVRDWPDALDAFTTREDVHVAGRLDINTASAEALAVLPGIDPALASGFVSERESLDAEERRSIIWPLTRGLLDEETFEAIVPFITNRSWTWRVRLAVGLVEASDPEGPIDRPVIYEAVIDLADPDPRIGYLREITMLQSSMELARLLATERTDPRPAEAERGPGSERGSEAPPISEPRSADLVIPVDPLEIPAVTGPSRIGRWLP